MVNQLAKEGCRRVATTTCEFQDTHTKCVNVFSKKVLGKHIVLTFPTGDGTRLHNVLWSYIRATQSRLKIKNALFL